MFEKEDKLNDMNRPTKDFFFEIKSLFLKYAQYIRVYFAEKDSTIKKIFPNFIMGINKNVFWSACLMCLLMSLIFLSFDSFYYTRSFKIAEKEILKSSCYLTKAYIKEYTIPFLRSTQLSASLIKNNVISPSKDYEQFYGYLLQQLKNNRGFVNIYLANQQGDLFLMTKINDKNEKDNYVMIKNLKKNDVTIVTETIVGADEKKISTKTHIVQQPDPRLRPWYVKAVKDKNITWSDAYIFHQYSDYIMPVTGITVSIPIYDDDGQLVGVFGIDMQFDRLSYAIKNSKLIKDVSAFIMNEDGSFKKNLYPYHQNKPITFFVSSNNKIGFSDLNSRYLDNVFFPYKQNAINDFIYNYKINGVSYSTFYTTLDNIIGSSWYIATVVPVASINWYLQQNKFVLVVYTVITLACLLCLFFIFSNQFAKAIKQIINYTNGIKDMDFSQNLTISSHIKEIKLLGQNIVLMGNVVKSFSRYVPSGLIREIIKSGVVSHIEGESYDMSILFIDICNFSSIAEGMNPQDLMEYLSEYFNQMAKVVYSKGGVLDKYIGDAIMCFFGAPSKDNNHALHGSQCAVMFFEALEEINKKWKLQRLPQISVRVSVASGPAVVGNVGSSDRLSYTALGNTVNIASRLEGLNKIYGSEILISENTYTQVKDQFLCRLADRVSVRGQTKGIYIYEIFRRNNMRAVSREELPNYNKEFFNAFKFYEVGDWEKSISLFENLSKTYSKDNLSTLYIERCKVLLKNPPKDWNGIWKF